MKFRISLLILLGGLHAFAQVEAPIPLDNPAPPSESPPAPPPPLPAPVPTFTPAAAPPPPPLPTRPGRSPNRARPRAESPAIKGDTAIKKGSGLQKLEKGRVSLDFVDAEIADIARSISELTKRNFILDDRVRGKVTIISPQPVTMEEAYQAFISALEVKGFTVVPAGKLLKIVPLRDMKTMPIPTNVDRPSGGDDIFVTRLIPIRYINAAEIVKSLRGLISKNGDLTSYDPTNTLIITDNVSNLRRIIRMIDLLDQKGYQETIEVIKLKYATAADAANKVMTLLNVQDTRAGGAPKPPTPAGEEPGAKGQVISKVLPDERTNSLIVMANQEGIRRVREIVEKLDAALETEISTGRIHVHYLQYADATELSATLGSLTGGGGGARPSRRSSRSSNRSSFGSNYFQGSTPPPPPPPVPVGPAGGANVSLFGGDIHITADEPTNSLVITADPADYESLLPIINKLDIRRPQAFIEAMIMEVDLDKAFEIGVGSHLGDQFGSGPTTVFGATQFGGVSSLAVPSDATAIAALQGFTFGLQGPTLDIPIGGGNSLTIPSYGALFRALQTNGTINILSTPNILTQDNKEAEISVGQVVPILRSQGLSSSGQPINSVDRLDVSLTLTINPQINESDDVTLDINQKIEDLGSAGDASLGPTTSKREAKTTVLVKDGQTVTIGGLISDQERTAISKVPILGDIPLLGWIFKNKSRSKRKTSLAIYITPHIIREPEDLQRVSLKKNEERLRFLKENGVAEHPGVEKYKMTQDFNVPPPKPLKNPVPADSPSGGFLSAPKPVPVPALPPPPAPPVVVPEAVPTPAPVEQPTESPEASAETSPPPEEPQPEATPSLDLPPEPPPPPAEGQ